MWRNYSYRWFRAGIKNNFSFRIGVSLFRESWLRIEVRTGDSWSWQADVKSALAFHFMQGRIYWLLLEADIPSSLSFIIWTHLLLLVMEYREDLPSWWPLQILASASPASGPQLITWVLLLVERERGHMSLSRVAVESPWQPVSVVMKYVSH